MNNDIPAIPAIPVIPLREGITVVIPTYNRGHLIRESLDSLLAQSVPAVRLIVVDDGSTDSTPEVVASYGTAVEYMRIENGGKANAINTVLPHIDTEYVWFFDDDDVALPWANECRLPALQANPELGFVFGGHQSFDHETQRDLYLYQPTVPPVDEQGFALMNGVFFMMCSCLVRMSCIFETGGLDPAFARSQDQEWFIRLGLNRPFGGVSRPVFRWRQHDGIRGPARNLHAVGERERVWWQADRRIGMGLRSRLPLTRFAAAGSASLSETAQHRLALVRRAAVMASKGLYQECFEDLDAAIKQPEAGAAHDQELRLVRELVHKPHFLNTFRFDRTAFLTAYADFRKRSPAHARLGKWLPIELLQRAIRYEEGRSNRLRALRDAWACFRAQG